MIRRINLLLKQINAVEHNLKGLSYEDFSKSDLLVRATCFSLIQIGEQMNKLEALLRPAYPDLPWAKARGLRNLIVHVYNNVDPDEIYNTAISDLPLLKKSFEAIKKSIN